MALAIGLTLDRDVQGRVSALGGRAGPAGVAGRVDRRFAEVDAGIVYLWWWAIAVIRFVAVGFRFFQPGWSKVDHA